MTKQNIIIGAIALVALLVGVWAKLTPAQSVQSTAVSYGAVSNTNAPAANTVLANGVLLPNPTVLDYVVSRAFLYADKAIGYGNSSGTTILQQGVRQAMVASTSVVCSLQNPFTATSTYEFTANIASSSANAGTLLLATAANTGATTTTQGGLAYSANSMLTMATQGTTTANIAGTVGPSAFLNLGAFGGGSAMLAQLGGNCNAVFTSTN